MRLDELDDRPDGADWLIRPAHDDPGGVPKQNFGSDFVEHDSVTEARRVSPLDRAHCSVRPVSPWELTQLCSASSAEGEQEKEKENTCFALET